ncbi:hypothetical protein [Sorangium sp. So ce385]|uniref:hypothetical protein n=1 Tax=Sorangium sp. So ce385 TaxID=3133308 RepID=UPI003F5B82D6
MNDRHDPGLGETDYNGRGPCKPCPVGFDCETVDDCLEGVCDSGICRAPTCTDGVKNGVETGVDCGAPCPRCAPEGDAHNVRQDIRPSTKSASDQSGQSVR